MTAESPVYKEPLPRSVPGKATPGKAAQNATIGTLRVDNHHIATQAVEKSYRKGQHKIPVLRGVNIKALKGSSSRSSGSPARARARCCTCSACSTRPTSAKILLDGERFLDDLPNRTRDPAPQPGSSALFSSSITCSPRAERFWKTSWRPLMIRYSALGILETTCREFLSANGPAKMHRRGRSRASHQTHAVGNVRR